MTTQVIADHTIPRAAQSTVAGHVCITAQTVTKHTTEEAAVGRRLASILTPVAAIACSEGGGSREAYCETVDTDTYWEAAAAIRTGPGDDVTSTDGIDRTEEAWATLGDLGGSLDPPGEIADDYKVLAGDEEGSYLKAGLAVVRISSEECSTIWNAD